VTSEYGKGTVFTATLTQRVADWKPMGNMGDIPPRSMETQRATFVAPDAEVLIVDDFSSNLLVVEGLLAPYRTRISSCLNGREAVALVQERSFDLVLMDHMMPEMDGVEATAAIRALGGRFAELPIIALTANAVSGMREMFLENGFNDFLSKPIDVPKLDEVLKEWIPARKRQRTPADSGKAPEAAAPPSDIVPLFPEMSGLDVAAGIARIGGSQSRYLHLLDTFRRDVEAGSALLEKEPEAVALQPFITLVHALKGALANIGADAQSRLAALLEQAGREGDVPMIRATLPAFREELAALTKRIGEISAQARSGDAGREDGLEAEPLERLRQALEARDIDGTDAVLAELQALPLDDKTRAAVAETADLVLLADFQRAASAVSALLERPKVS
ncbi:MAG: response regulator, partial [Desulfovibrio sp.]|jgi:CheY-like chemotaxis protein|nr:response regulator [Desulfovibrio sp.]